VKLLVVAAIAAVLGALALRVVVAGRSALGDGDDWMLRGKPAEAIRSYEAAARWYLPLAPHVDAAYARLRTLTDTQDALQAWQAIRSAARATRSLWQPHAEDLADADAAIARLEARDPAAGAGAGDTTKAREDWYRAKLAEDGRPGIGAAVLAGFGILAWLAGAGVLARRGIDEAGRLVQRPALAGVTAIVLGVGAWIAGLYNA
jgi:hypothetical protein